MSNFLPAIVLTANEPTSSTARAVPESEMNSCN
jgi:hypothetical protein